MSGFVYIWRDRKHKRYYIGSHWGTEDDGYICSSTWMLNAFKRRPEDFGKRRILKRIYTNRHDLLKEEQRWLDMIPDNELGKKYYNLYKRVSKSWYDDPTKAANVRKKIGLKSRQNKNHQYARRAWLQPAKKIEICKKLSKTRKGKAWAPPKFPLQTIETLYQLYKQKPDVGFIGKCPKSGQLISYERAFSKKYAEYFNMTSNHIQNLITGKTILWKEQYEKILDSKS